MKYEKPKIIKVIALLPPVTVNFAPPAVQIKAKSTGSSDKKK